MDELVTKLSTKQHAIRAHRIDKSIELLQKRISLKHIHILFEETGTEIGIKLDSENCNYDSANFDKKTGKIHLEGVLTLNYEKVKCIANVSIRTMKGKGRLELIENEAEYARIIED